MTIEEKIDKLISDVAAIKVNSERIISDVEDHEDRIREVESFRNQFKGAVISIGFASGFIGTIVGIIASLFLR